MTTTITKRSTLTPIQDHTVTPKEIIDKTVIGKLVNILINRPTSTPNKTETTISIIIKINTVFSSYNKRNIDSNTNW